MVGLPCLTLNSESQIPFLGFGTGGLGPLRQVSDEEARKAIAAGLECGYRHLDTAAFYRNEHLVGQVLGEWISAGKLKREEVFVTTKLPPTGLCESKVEEWMLRSLENLKLSYVDLYLIHFPVAMFGKEGETTPLTTDDGRVSFNPKASLEGVWKAMEKQVKAGRAKAIGLSNFNSSQISRILKVCEIRPSALQVEVNAYHQQRLLREFCGRHQIPVCAYAPLGAPGTPFSSKHPQLIEDPAVVALATEYERTPAQVLLRYLVQQGVVAVAKSGNPERMRTNMQIFDFSIKPEDMKLLDNLDKGKDSKIYTMKSFLGIEDQPEYPFNAPF
ncbi:aldo-keto reductase family 1 member A1-A-like [Penaeus japonicus]|uniref:aldo-keto reductase family 1 member A1-A-like n=1 Tax=Penaeus japonicus TaxID=27405 RepID=UPI001C715BBB|nr:aldo-keto reductase family 1 member A1-A-like [Penaeus japonicus]